MRACVICDGPLPEGSGPDRTACDKPECRSAMQTWASSRRPVVRRARQEELRGERVCDVCGVSKPLDAEHFPHAARRGDKVWLRRSCRSCWAKNAGGKARAKYRAKVKADPVLYARELEDARIRAALKRERETGRLAPNQKQRDVPNAYREDLGGGATLVDTAPIGMWLDVVFAREVPDYGVMVGDNSRHNRGMTTEEFAETLDVSSKRIWAIRERAQEHVAFTTVDKLLTNYTGMVDGNEMADMLAERCREMPGNGERILRYIDLAERIAHLDGVGVVRPADLYPEFA